MTLKQLYDELETADQSAFRSKIINKLFPKELEATERIVARLDDYYERKFVEKGF